MYIPCLQTENQNNFRQGTLENDWTSTSELERNVASYTPTSPVPEMNIWIYWSESNSCIYFYIVLNKNWK